MTTTQSLSYHAKDGKALEFDTSREACEKYGFFAGSRVLTPKGPALETGLIVNIHFNSMLGFEKTAPCQIFDYLKIKLVHGWIIDPQQLEANALVSNLSYNELAAKMVNFEQSFPNTKIGTEQQEYGLKLIQSGLEEDELCVFFRNNHFATMTKHDGFLHILVSDVGYEAERMIVWDRIMTIGGENIFLSGDFKTRKESSLEEVKLNLIAIGYKESEVKEAMDHINSVDSNEDPFEIATNYMTSKNYFPS
eukprot:gene17469-20844_t